MGYPQTYQQATRGLEHNHGDDLEENLRALAAFQALFADFKQENFEARVNEAYAETLYFNDTIKSFTRRDELSEYLRETAGRVSYTRVRFDDVTRSGDNYYVRWTMEVGFRVLSRDIHTESIGMSQVRLDGDGKVIFHQDFWDSAEGFYRHLPVIGYLINRTRARL